MTIPIFRKHLFEPFSQENDDAGTNYQGVGLGMSIVKSIVDKMGGTIEVQSKVGEGSTLKVTIPYKIATEEMVRSKTVEKESDVLINGMHIMLVEDNDLNAEIAEYILKEAGAEVTTVRNGQEFLDAYTASEAGFFDVILMDIMMPVMDGITAAGKIRSSGRPDSADIPIIAMTANAFAEDAKKCTEAGMNANLAKPLDVKKLMSTIARLSASSGSAVTEENN